MLKFASGLTIGVAVGYIFSETIDEARHAIWLRIRELNEAAAEQRDEDEEHNLVASLHFPANGTTLSADRKSEINNSTPSNPIVLTQEDIDEMNLAHLKIHIGSGRFKLHEDSTP